MDKINYIEGVELIPLKKIENPLGDVFHGMKKTDKGFAGFQEAYFSTVHYGIIKPWKKHLRMTLNLVVPVGEIRFVLYDERAESVTYGNFMDVSLSLENYCRLTIPPDIWVTFKGEKTSMNLLLNIANLEHDPDEIIRGEREMFSFNWD